MSLHLHSLCAPKVCIVISMRPKGLHSPCICAFPMQAPFLPAYVLAYVESIFSGTGKFTDEAKSTGHCKAGTGLGLGILRPVNTWD